MVKLLPFKGKFFLEKLKSMEEMHKKFLKKFLPK